jgi:hypothetical protein
MRSAGAQVSVNPHANKTARQVLELPTLHIWLSEFRLDRPAVAGKERKKSDGHVIHDWHLANATMRSPDDYASAWSILKPRTTAVPNPQLNTNSLCPSVLEEKSSVPDQQAVFVQNRG